MSNENRIKRKPAGNPPAAYRQLVDDRDASAIIEVLKRNAMSGDAAAAAVLLMLPNPNRVMSMSQMPGILA